MGIHKDELVQYALRQLGAPLLEINVSPDQMSDAVDDTIQLFNESHGDGSEKFFVRHIVTAQDIANRYIGLPDSIRAVVQVLPLNQTSSFYATEPLFSPIGQFMQDEVWGLNSQSVVHYHMAMANYRLIQNMFADTPNVDFNVYTGKLKLDTNWDRFIPDETVIILEVWKALDPEEYKKIYTDRWVKRYVTARIKKQWGTNLKKFSGVQLPGGITLNGDTIYTEAVEEIANLEEELRTRYELPIDFFIGSSM